MMNLETSPTPWSYDELQLMGIELGDTVEFIDENGKSYNGVIVFLNKMTIYVLILDNSIFKFGRITLMSIDNKFEIIGLSKEEIRISASVWKKAKDEIIATLKKERKK